MLKMKPIDLRNCSLLELCFHVTGKYRLAGKLAGFIMAWRVAEKDLGRVPLQREYAAYWKMSLATAEREMALFKKHFPKLSSPSEIPIAAESPGRKPVAAEAWDFTKLSAVA